MISLDLSAGLKVFSYENSQELLVELELWRISIINLCKIDVIKDIDKKKLFYKTDHHWPIVPCYQAFVETLLFHICHFILGRRGVKKFIG